MINRNLYIFIGKKICDEDINAIYGMMELEESKKANILFIDKDCLNALNVLKNEGIEIIDCFEEGNLRNKFESLSQVSNIVLIPSVTTNVCEEDIMKECKETLTKIFLVTKAFYRVAISIKNVRIWYVTNIIPQKVINLYITCVLECFNRGITSVALILGNEFSKKKINVNTIERTSRCNLEKIEKILSYLSQDILYMNLQSILI